MQGTRALIAALLLGFAATAAANCSIYVSGTNFGAYDIFNPAPTFSNGDIAVTCDWGTPYIIKLDAGANSGGNFFPRKLYSTFTGSTLDYSLYKDPSYSEVWGDDTPVGTSVSGVGTGGTELYRVYGLLFPGQHVASGAYSDSIVVLLEW